MHSHCLLLGWHPKGSRLRKRLAAAVRSLICSPCLGFTSRFTSGKPPDFSTAMSHRACANTPCKFLAETAAPRNANALTVFQKARGVSEIQAHVLRFNGKLEKSVGVGSIGPVEQYRCQLFQDLISDVGVVGDTVALGTQLPQDIFRVRLERSNHRRGSPVEDI